MRLRTTAGAYAGQIRDYGLVAGRAALAAGTAERVDITMPASGQLTAASTPASIAGASKRKSRRSQ